MGGRFAGALLILIQDVLPAYRFAGLATDRAVTARVVTDRVATDRVVADRVVADRVATPATRASEGVRGNRQAAKRQNGC
jgi:hypothetical protein